MAPLSLKIIQDNGAVTRKVKFDTLTTVQKAHEIVKEKVRVPDGGKEYGLFLRSTDDELSGIWLEGHRTLSYYMLRDGDSLDYICKIRNLRVRMLDDAVKTLQVDESKTVGELMLTICSRIGISNHDEYGLCHEEAEATSEDNKEKLANTGTLTLKRKAPQKEKDDDLEQLSKKLKTDDIVKWLDKHKTLRELGVDPAETLLLKRRLFYSDRNVDERDPLQLNLLYVQTRDAILQARHPVTEEQALECKVRWINIRDVNRRIIKKSFDQKKPRRAYKYENALAFMKPFYKDVPLPRADDSDDADKNYEQWDDTVIEYNDIPDPCHSDNSEDKPVRKRKVKKSCKSAKKRKEISYVEEKLPSSNFNETTPSEFDPADPVDAFLLSIGATLKTFSPYHLNLAKSKIFGVVQEHDLEQIVQRQQDGQSDIKISTTESIIYLQE